jgi:hypothetical protein
MRDDPAPEIDSLTAEEFWTSVIFLLVLVGLFVAEICVNYHPAKLTALFVVLAWVPLLVLHEAGHALVAVLLGWRVHAVVIGMGRPLARFQVGRTPVEIRMFPVEGFVLPAPTNLRTPHLKSALIYFAGPGAELLLAALLACAIGLDTFLSRTENIWLLAAQSVAVAALISAFFNLVPQYAIRQGGRIPNDGLGIILSFLRPREDYARQLAEPDMPWKAEPTWESEEDEREER